MARYRPTKPDPDAVWITVPEAMWIGRVSQSWLFKRMSEEAFESKLAGRYRIIRRESFERYIENLPSRRQHAVAA